MGLVRPLRIYLIDLLKLYTTWSHVLVDLVPRLVSNLGNLHCILLHGLDPDHTDLRDSILGIMMLNTLSMMMMCGPTPLMLRLSDILSGMDDHQLHRWFITEMFWARDFYTLPNLEMAIEEGIKHFRLIQNPDEEG
jgi:hypothetical protein